MQSCFHSSTGVTRRSCNFPPAATLTTDLEATRRGSDGSGTVRQRHTLFWHQDRIRSAPQPFILDLTSTCSGQDGPDYSPSQDSIRLVHRLCALNPLITRLHFSSSREKLQTLSPHFLFNLIHDTHATMPDLEMTSKELMRTCVVGGNAVSAFLSWRLQATNACDVTLVWKSGFDAVAQYGISFK